MSFRNRLTLFFVVIVIVPMLAVAYVLFNLAAKSDDTKVRTRLVQAQRAAQGIFDDAQDRAAATGRRIGSDADLARAMRARDRTRSRARLEVLSRNAGVVRLLADLQGMGSVTLGRGAAVGPATSRLVDGSRPAGRLRVSMLSATGYVRQVKRATGLEVVVEESGRVVAESLPSATAGRRIPAEGAIELGDSTYRLVSFRAPGFEDRSVRIGLLTRDPAATSRAVVAAALAGFLLLALAFALAVSRSLQAQVGRLLDAAHRVGRGDFDVVVPTEGDDEFAALGSEFNQMARQLQTRVEELQLERARLQDAIRRVGESFAKGLDRDALLDIVVETAVDGVGADCGRAIVHDASGTSVEAARSGDVSAHHAALEEVEAAASDSTRAVEITDNGASALAQPLCSSEGGQVLGLISVARVSRPFTEPEKELFNYLASQAAVSVENVDLHETVQRQAVTDELTGLFNHRRFQEVMALEIERTRRFGSDMGLILLDMDDFKKVNDTYGHMQGDMVLREVARVLRESAREIDEPARYGGEEMAVALPQTDLDGAYRFAERVRRQIEALELPILDGERPGMLRVTASFGAAALPKDEDAGRDALVAAADAALYEAKRAGKNRTVKAG
ncbi:MAG: diguanylate cyclase [Solirubrobacterales bacterium]|jgi:diguanylate cyclase (GGDEF)-like protein|nr:diguanylate cyclase [Solirubrobacterales bacterium]